MHATKPAASEGEGTDVRPAAARAPVAAAGGPRPAVLDIPQPAAGGGRLGRLVALLPGGERLDDVSYAQRHRLGQLCLAFMAALLTVVAIVNERDLDVGHLAVDLSPMFVSWFIAWRAPNRTVSTLSVSFGLMAASSILVHLTEGLIEAHFLFFVLLPLIALYQDWRAFLGAIGFVVFHHAVVGTLAPEAVYNHPAAQAKPVLWGVIHTLFVVGLVLVLLAEWNFAEAEQRKTYRALSELTETQTELLAAQKMESIGQLAAGIAHEINTPMQYIGDNTSFLKASIGELLRFVDAAAACVDEAEQQGELTASQQSLAELLVSRRLTMLRERAPTAADDALSGVESVTGIVRAMKRFSHPGGDTPEPVDVNESILTTTIVCRNEWKYAADLVTDLDPDLPLVEGYLGSLNQVWLNMIVNASHAVTERRGPGGEKGSIRIATRSLDGGRTIEVRIGDDGSGIAPENLRRVFDHFFTTKEVGRGTGQGLSIAYQTIVKDHNGTVDVESTVGEGTTFTLTLPVTAPVAAITRGDT